MAFAVCTRYVQPLFRFSDYNHFVRPVPLGFQSDDIRNCLKFVQVHRMIEHVDISVFQFMEVALNQVVAKEVRSAIFSFLVAD